MCVSSTYQLFPTLPRRRRRRPSANGGVSLASQSRTASWLNDAAHQEHLRQIAQAEFVAQPPEHHERDDIRRVLRPVQQALAALVELLAAVATAKSPVALSGPLGPF